MRALRAVFGTLVAVLASACATANPAGIPAGPLPGIMGSNRSGPGRRQRRRRRRSPKKKVLGTLGGSPPPPPEVPDTFSGPDTEEPGSTEHKHTIALGDRIVCAGISSVLMMVTLTVGAAITTVLLIMTGIIPPSRSFGFVQLDGFLIWLFTLTTFSTAVLGFVLGPDRMLRVWRVIWQTEKPAPAELVIAVCVLCGIVFAMVTYVVNRLDVLQL
jgi:hypothetical protein